MKITTEIHTTIRITDVETTWDRLEALTKMVKKIYKDATVNYNGTSCNGFMLVFPGAISEALDEKKILAALAAGDKVDQDREEDNKKFALAFEIPTIPKYSLKPSNQKKAADELVDLIASYIVDFHGHRNKKEWSEACCCAGDLMDYVDLLKAIIAGDKKAAVKEIRSMDTSPRENLSDVVRRWCGDEEEDD
jgi:hypothetical protein